MIMEQQEPGESCCVPPGFRFHPTEEELVGYYLARKVASRKIDLDIIQELDLYRIEPWDLQERCSAGGGGVAGHDEQQMTAAEWYFFSYKDRKYPSGTRTNRATAAGFWKATGRDKPVASSCSSSRRSRVVIGMRKTLVFYKGRAPNGSKTHWIMHEYRLVQSNHLHHATTPPPPQEEGWVVCRAFQKPIPNQQLLQRPAAAGYYYYYDHLLPSPSAALNCSSFLSPMMIPPPQLIYSDDDQQQQQQQEHRSHLCCFSLPQLVESPASTTTTASIAACGGCAQQTANSAGAIDWNFLDTLLSQLHEPSAAFLQ